HFSCLLWGERSFVANAYLSPKVMCHSPADLPMPSCTSFPPHTPLQLLSSRRSGAEPCTAQRSGGGATSSFDLLKRALFHNALTVIYDMSSRLSQMPVHCEVV